MAPRKRHNETTVDADRSHEEGAAQTFSLLVACVGRLSVHPLPRIGAVTVGRDDDCAIPIAHPSISRRHAEIVIGETVAIRDLGSRNGTRVRERQVDGSLVDLTIGDVVELGVATLVLQRAPAALVPARASSREPDGAATASGPPIIVDETMVALYALADRIAASDITVLLHGETGVGKEVIAERIHRSSPRRDGPYLRLNCAALPEGVLESELFGCERGAFTGAVQSRLGLLETANGGTVLLDEVGELTASVQAKLLRVLEDRHFFRVGGRKPISVDVRFLAATHCDLKSESAKGRFRQDLYYRLSGVTLAIPPLRERTSEIEPLAEMLLVRASKAMGRARPPTLAGDARAWLRAHAWPGNVRELRNVLEGAVARCAGEEITCEDLPRDPAEQSPGIPTAPPPPSTAPLLKHELRDIERQRIVEALERCAGNQTKAAALLGLSRRAFVARLDEYGLPRPRKP